MSRRRCEFLCNASARFSVWNAGFLCTSTCCNAFGSAASIAPTAFAAGAGSDPGLGGDCVGGEEASRFARSARAPSPLLCSHRPLPPAVATRRRFSFTPTQGRKKSSTPAAAREPSPLIYNFTKDRKPAACAARGGAAAPAPAGAMPTAVGASHGPGGEGGAAGVAPQAVASCKISVTGASPSSGETSVAVTRKDIAALETYGADPVFSVPISLHAGWVCAALLLNVNLANVKIVEEQCLVIHIT